MGCSARSQSTLQRRCHPGEAPQESARLRCPAPAFRAGSADQLLVGAELLEAHVRVVHLAERGLEIREQVEHLLQVDRVAQQLRLVAQLLCGDADPVGGGGLEWIAHREGLFQLPQALAEPLPRARAAEGSTTAHVRQGAKDLRLRSEEHTSELQSRSDLVCRLLLEKKKKKTINIILKKQKNNKK